MLGDLVKDAIFGRECHDREFIPGSIRPRSLSANRCVEVTRTCPMLRSRSERSERLNYSSEIGGKRHRCESKSFVKPLWYVFALLIDDHSQDLTAGLFKQINSSSRHLPTDSFRFDHERNPV